MSASKEQIVDQLHHQLDEASRTIDELRFKASLAKADAKTAIEERIHHLEERKTKLNEQLHHLKHSAGDAWETLAEGCHKSWSEFKQAVQQAVAEFKS